MKHVRICCCSAFLAVAACELVRDIELVTDHPAHPQAAEAPVPIRVEILRPDPELAQPVPPTAPAVRPERHRDHPQPDPPEHREPHQHHQQGDHP